MWGKQPQQGLGGGLRGAAGTLLGAAPEMSWGRRSLCERRQRPSVACAPPTPKQGQLFRHKGCTVRLGPPAGGGGRGWGVSLRNGPGSRVAGGLGRAAQQGPREHPGPRTSPVSSDLPPVSVLQRRGGAWGQLGSPIRVRGWCPEPWEGPEPMASQSHLDLIVLLGIGKLKGVCLHCAGHGGPAACPGCPPLFVQALPRSPSLGQHPC